jgi:hypothetical protein
MQGKKVRRSSPGRLERRKRKLVERATIFARPAVRVKGASCVH